jgi:LacI family transcriptional regulator
MKRVTLADVARKAGVHPTSVSMALRNHPDLPIATRERLQAVAKAMGYVPDPNLSALVAYRTRNSNSGNSRPLAYITNWDTREGWKEKPAHAQFFSGAREKARELGYHLDHFWLSEPGFTPQRISQILYTRGISGLIFASHLNDSDKLLAFDWSKFCSVKIDYAPRNPPIHNISNDQRSMMQTAMQKVRAAGYKRPALITTKQFDEFVRQGWSAGFLVEQQWLPPEDRIPIFHTTDAAADSAEGKQIREEFARWLQIHQPDVILSYSQFALPLLNALNVSVPRDVAYVELFLQNTSGEFAGMRENCVRVGEVAVEFLAGQLQQNRVGIPAYPMATLVEGTWFDGASLPVKGNAVEEVHQHAQTR